MAKGSNLVTDRLSGNLGDLTFVNSKRYGPHVRRKRGSSKPAKLNEAMQKSALRMSAANVPAKAIFDAIRIYHKDGELWNKLIVIFRKQIKVGRHFSIEALDNLECHDTCTLDRLMCSTGYHITHHLQDEKLYVDLRLSEHPDWSYLNWKESFQYRLSIIAVFPDLAQGRFERETAHGPITAFTEPPSPVSFEIPLPDRGNEYVLFLLATVCQNGEAVNTANVRGMGVVGMGGFS